MNITQKLVEEVISFTYTSLSPETVTITKLALMDNLGTTLFGYQQVDKPLVGYAKATGGTPQATVIGGGHKVSNGLESLLSKLAHRWKTKAFFKPCIPISIIGFATPTIE